MAASQDRQAQAEAVAAFEARIEQLRHEGVYVKDLRDTLPWAAATEADKLEAIVMAAQYASPDGGSTVPGSVTLQAIEREVDEARMPEFTQEMLRALRANMADGHLDGPHPKHNMDRAWMALRDIVAASELELMVKTITQEGGLWRPIPEDNKAGMIVNLGLAAGSPGTHSLAAIEREVDFDGLSPWRREALQDVRRRLDRGELVGEDANPVYQGDRVHSALRLAEFEARVEDFKQEGVTDDDATLRRWWDLSDEEKFGRIMGIIRDLHLEYELAAYRVLGREVDIGHPPDAFDRIVANLPRQWREDGHGDGVETWEEQSAVEKIGYLAGYAAAHRVWFDRFVDAAAHTLGLASWEEFTADDIGHLLAQIRWAHGDYSEDPAAIPLLSAPKDGVPSPAAIADDRDEMLPEGATKADKLARYDSPPESIERARKLMREVKEALTKDADGKFPASYADMDWDGMNMWRPDTAWQDMDIGQRYDMLLHALDESIWSLEPSDKWDEPRDSKKLANEFVKEDARQAMPGFRADAFEELTTRLEAFRDEFARLDVRFGEFVSDAYVVIAKLAEDRRDARPEEGQALPSPGAIAEDRGGPDSPAPERGRGRGR